MEGGALGLAVSTLKMRASEIQQHIAKPRWRRSVRALPPASADRCRRAECGSPGIERAPRYFYMRKPSIYGGSSEIQKNVIAKQLFGA